MSLDITLHPRGRSQIMEPGGIGGARRRSERLRAASVGVPDSLMTTPSKGATPTPAPTGAGHGDGVLGVPDDCVVVPWASPVVNQRFHRMAEAKTGLIAACHGSGFQPFVVRCRYNPLRIYYGCPHGRASRPSRLRSCPWEVCVSNDVARGDYVIRHPAGGRDSVPCNYHNHALGSASDISDALEAKVVGAGLPYGDTAAALEPWARPNAGRRLPGMAEEAGGDGLEAKEGNQAGGGARPADDVWHAQGSAAGLADTDEVARHGAGPCGRGAPSDHGPSGDGQLSNTDGGDGQPPAGHEAVVTGGMEVDAAPGGPASGRVPGLEICDPRQTFGNVFNLGDGFVDSITSHRIRYSGGKYTVELWAVAREACSYATGWKTELELSWIVMDKVTAYWAAFEGGRDGGLCPAEPRLRIDGVLVVLGHRKKRYGRLEFKVLLQGTVPDPVWVDDTFMLRDWRGMLRDWRGMAIDPRILDHYWEATGSPTRFEGLQDIAPESCVDLVVEEDGIALRPTGGATLPRLTASPPPHLLPQRVSQLRPRGKGALRPAPYGFPAELYSHLFRPASRRGVMKRKRDTSE